MTRLAYIHNNFVPHNFAVTHIEDRGYQFADSVYEVVPIINGRLVDLTGHMIRLWRSLQELQIEFDMPKRALVLKMMELIRQNQVQEGNIYLQISRGIGAREHSYAEKDWEAVLVMVTNQLSHNLHSMPKPQKVITVPDLRWHRRDIKTTSLLANCMAASTAQEHKAYEAWQVENGKITEGTHSNAWIVTKDNVVKTHKASTDILNGITRLSLLELIKKHGFKAEQKAFTITEAYNAKEAFLTSSGGFVKPIVQIDDKKIGNGKAGEICKILFEHYRTYCLDDIHPSAFLPLSAQAPLRLE